MNDKEIEEDNSSIHEPEVEEIPAIIESYVVEDSSDEETECSDLSKINVGILDDALAALKEKSHSEKPNNLLCSLLIDEVKLTPKYEKYKGKTFGGTEGIGKSPLHEPKKMATKAVIFMVVSQTADWSIPVGIFFAHNPDIKYFADTITDALDILYDHGVQIISITLNCISPHLSFALAEELGAKFNSSNIDLIEPHFKHSKSNKMVYIFYDLDTILAYLKTYWATERVICHANCLIYYNLCLDVKKIHETDLGNYKLEDMCDWIIIRKRLTYDTELIGKTTADALYYLRGLGHPDFLGSGPTIQFMKVLDLLAQISRINGINEELYPNLSNSNAVHWEPIFKNIIKYVKSLRSINKSIPQHLCILSTCVTGIVVSLISFHHLYQSFVLKTHEGDKDPSVTLPYLTPSRFSLKHIRDKMPLDDVPEKTLTALWVFKKIKSLSDSLQVIKP